MTISVLNESLLLRNQHPEHLRDYLKSINLTVFDKVYESLPIEEAHLSVLFILCGYSEESPLVILRQDTKEEKIGICDYLAIPEDLKLRLMNLSDVAVRKATTSFMQQFAGPMFRGLMFMKIQYNDLELDVTNRAACVRKIEEEDGKTTTTETFDYKEHGKAITEMGRLAKEMGRLENLIKDQVKKMDGIEGLLNYMSVQKKSGKLQGARRGNIERLSPEKKNKDVN